MSLEKAGLEKIYTGKTKDVYQYDEGKILLYSKDAVTGWKIKNADGSISIVEDPGANEVTGEIPGIGKKNLVSSEYYFKRLEKHGIATHFIAMDLQENTMLVHEAKPLGHGLECIVRFNAMGSIIRRFPDYLTENQELHEFFEITTKNDEAGDPPISKELLCSPDFGPVMTEAQYEECKQLCLKAAKLIQLDLADIDLTLKDLKFEIGMVNGKIVIIDEISAGIMRVYSGTKKLSEEELADVFVTREAPVKHEVPKVFTLTQQPNN